MGRSCSELLAGGGLFILNGVDLIAGIALCIYSLDLISTCNNTPMYLYVPLLAIGTVLVVASIMSSCGLVYQECSVCVALSSSVLGWISLAELGLAVVILTQGGSIDEFLRNHSSELQLRSESY
uniref:Uncharacterized protein n=1 Tax=Hyaloperonospora arabidopsidis (strain Emoy2) TaxID=559515 RepID=M4B2M8_HYAAE